MSLAKKLKSIVKREPQPATFGKDPNEPWSVRAGITESESSMLSAYLKSRGINPEFVSKDTKISHAKSSEFSKWKRDHMFDDPADTVSSVVRDKMKAQREEVEVLEAVDKEDTITFDIPLLIRMFEYAREDAKTDMDLHKVTEKLISIRDKGTLTMADYDFIVKLKESVEIMEKKDPCWTGYQMVGMKKKGGKPVPNCVPESFEDEHGIGRDPAEKKSKMTALEKWRSAADKRAKKHADISKNSGGMTSAIDRLEKHLNKEETDKIDIDTVYPNNGGPKINPKTRLGGGKDIGTQVSDKTKTKGTFNKIKDRFLSKMSEDTEQIDELKKSTVKSWLGQQEVVPPKKPGMDRKAHNQRIKTRSKSWDRALDRLTGAKPTSEDVYQDSQAATQTPCDCGTTPNQTEPTYSKKKEMSKSARMIKALYKKHKMVKEELYDHEKEDKSVATYGKKPKVQKLETFSDKEDQAAMVLKGGTTMTGQTRDTLEIDPVMRKANKNNDNKTNK